MMDLLKTPNRTEGGTAMGGLVVLNFDMCSGLNFMKKASMTST